MKRRQKRKWAPRRAEIKKEQAVSCRVPNHVHERIVRAASRHHWTVSAEIAQRLEDSLALPETPTTALMAVVAYAIDAMSRGKKTWLTDPYLHQQAHEAVVAAFQLVQPKGYPPKPETKPSVDDDRPRGRIGLQILWNEIRTHVPGTLPPLRKDGTRAKKSVARLQYERRLLAFREGLGKLMDRVVLWGKSGREARRTSQALSIEDLQKFVKLSRKRITDGLTEEEHTSFVALYDRYPKKEALSLGDLASPGPFGKILSTDEESES
jgi:hypothetical protein